MKPRALWVGLLFAFNGCASGGGEGATAGWASKVPWIGEKSGEATMLAGVKPGPYEPSSLAVGEEKDLARHRGEALGFVRAPVLEQHLAELRASLVQASRKTGVPGRVVILASASYDAFSTPDGNVYVSMGLVSALESDDEVAAVVAHELSHVLLKHHTSDVLADMEKRGQALYELGLDAKTQFTGTQAGKGDTRNLLAIQAATEATDKVMLPAWGRGQERDADRLGVDLLVESGHSAPAMISMLEKLQAWETANAQAEQDFWERMKQASQRNLNETVGVLYQKVTQSTSDAHPKTAERMEDTARYLERHYGNRDLAEPKADAWTSAKSRPEVAQVLQNYKQAFAARRLLEEGKAQDAYTAARTAATGRTANDAYPNWILSRSAIAVGRQNEAIDALRRAVGSAEPVAVVYEDLILVNEREGRVPVALDWADRASQVFAGAPRWTPHKIRLLRKTGRIIEANTLALNCSVSTPDLKRQCQEANQTPAGQTRR